MDIVLWSWSTSVLIIVLFQKTFILLPQKEWNFKRVRSIEQNNFKKCIKLNWNFQRGGMWGGGVFLEIVPSMGEV